MSGATYEDLLKVPDLFIAELIGGHLFSSRRSAPLQLRAQIRLVARLFPLEERGSWIFMVSPALHLGGDVLVPDIAGWRAERMPETPETDGVEIVPDWVCEVISDTRLDRGVKLPAYGRHGVPCLWMIDARYRFMEVYVLQNGQWAIAAARGRGAGRCRAVRGARHPAGRPLRSGARVTRGDLAPPPRRAIRSLRRPSAR